MLKHKHYLQNKYRHSKLEEDRIRLRSWNKLVQLELNSFRQNNWNIFISQAASPNPKHFWQTVKCLNKKKSSNFSAITENNHMYKTSDENFITLLEHFSNRFTAPKLCINNTTDVLASNLWSKLSNSNQHDIELVCENSDLKFSTHDLKHQGFILKLYQLNCPYAYLFWIINYFKDRTITLDYQGHLSKQVKVNRGTPQGSCFGPKTYIVNHFDLPSIFDCPSEVHLYVDDLAILFSPSIYLKYAQQVYEIETRINKDLLKLANYAESNHQPIYNKKTDTWLRDEDSPVLVRLSQLISALTNLTMETAEEVHVVNYGVGGYYSPHLDFYHKWENPAYFRKAGNRIATWMTYMSDVEWGGATVFPLSGGHIVPKKGSTVFWYNLNASGEADYRTLHAACPVLIGNKWVATKWIHEHGQEFRRRCSLDPMV
ncbi:unnamed protein product [Rotaria magnacalcarata]|uniref:Fe2OG dioxygenase domain-containing protein n=3 Tax=Rotaria magnacalcarata TaxID=392030 RepID=A0A816XU50_9BILA|nr:unnamed protein product [Rotaria magnacalcarata]